MKTAIDIISESGAMTALATCRIGGFVAISPFPGSWVSVTQRVGLVVVLSGLVAMTFPQPDLGFDERLILAVPTEIVCGLMLGGLFRLSMMAVDVLGGAFSQATGLGVASVLNPATDAQDTTTGRIVSLLGTMIALSVSAHRVALGYLLASYRTLPAGSPLALDAAAPTLVATFESSFAFGLRLSMPLLGCALAAQLLLAIVARVAPAMQIFNTGMTVMVFAGLATFIASSGDVTTALAGDFGELGSRFDALLGALGSHAEASGP